MTLDENRAQLLELIGKLAYKKGDFVLSSGQKSSYYINGKLVTLHPQGARYIGEIMHALLPPDTVAVGGLTLGADPIVSAITVVSAYTDRPVYGLIVRKQAKEHGTGQTIEGCSLPPGSRVVVVEDVVTTGASALWAVHQLRGAGYRVEDVFAIVDRQEGAAERFAQEGLQLHALFTIEEIQALFP
ncbi:MAG: orotate phosphoribosyltransferase [Pseudanabaenaceae cyanobacterium SKYGB_i_bin29]|nr:orotate phosphoribosyltransferase [Pseudanabaenaceae cyanobacterium SKYG29]MDW8422574.1 orotate phosphoribosyltransferase [Pseudanabaenaceae cyanobacterium SKYGB_i_bin29]